MADGYPKTRTAVKKLGASTFTLLSADNAKKPLRRGDMVKITVVQEAKGAPFKEVGAEDSVDQVVGSKDLKAICRMIATLESNKTLLVEAALRLPNGAEVLEQGGFYDSAAAAENTVADTEDDFVGFDENAGGLADSVEGLDEVELSPGDDPSKAVVPGAPGAENDSVDTSEI